MWVCVHVCEGGGGGEEEVGGVTLCTGVMVQPSQPLSGGGQ